MVSPQHIHISNINTLSSLNVCIYLCVYIYMHSCMWFCICVCITIKKGGMNLRGKGALEKLQREERRKWCNYNKKNIVKLWKDKKTRALVYKLLKSLFRKRKRVERKEVSINSTRNVSEVKPLSFLAKRTMKMFMLEGFM